MIKLNTVASPLKLESAKPALGEAAQRRIKLKKATEAFEAIFIAQLLKNMRSTSFTNKEEDGFGKDIMLAMADEGVARQLSKTGMFGVGKILYQNLVKRLEEKPATTTGLQITSERHIDGIAPARASKPTVIESATKTAAPAVSLADPEQTTPAAPAPTPAMKPADPKAQSSTTPKSAAVARLDKYIEHIREAAHETNLSEDLLKAVIKNESNGDTTAVSPSGAAGLMQLMPDTARAVGVSDRFDPRENILGGARYLRQMVDRYGDLKTALAAYNAGPGNVDKHGGVPPFPETENYIRRVLSDLSGDR